MPSGNENRRSNLGVQGRGDPGEEVGRPECVSEFEVMLAVECGSGVRGAWPGFTGFSSNIGPIGQFRSEGYVRKEVKMLKKSLFAVAVVALLAATVPAGEIKIHDWPTTFVPQELTDIPVLMDVGYWVYIKDQDKLKIKLQQKSITEYEGCTDVTLQCNFSLKGSCSISATGAVPGKYSCSVLNGNIDSPGGTLTVCAQLKEAKLVGTPGAQKDVHVATVTLKVAPR
jgi:hypothetical protein